jgi:hypothetical protein
MARRLAIPTTYLLAQENGRVSNHVECLAVMGGSGMRLAHLTLLTDLSTPSGLPDRLVEEESSRKGQHGERTEGEEPSEKAGYLM